MGKGISRALAEQLVAEAVAAGRMTPVAGVGVNVAAFCPAPAGAPARRGRKKPAALVEPGFAGSGRRAEWTVPLKLERTTNDGALKKWLIGVAGKHRREVGRALAGRLRNLARYREAIDGGGAVRCTITRVGGGGAMDDDNLPGTGKWVRDTVALFLGQDDGPRGPILWSYAQEPGPAWGVRITLETT